MDFLGEVHAACCEQIDRRCRTAEVMDSTSAWRSCCAFPPAASATGIQYRM